MASGTGRAPPRIAMMQPAPNSYTRRNLSLRSLLNTLETERYRKQAVLSALLDELRRAMSDRATASVCELMTRAEHGGLTDSEYAALLDEIRAVVRVTDSTRVFSTRPMPLSPWCDERLAS